MNSGCFGAEVICIFDIHIFEINKKYECLFLPDFSIPKYEDTFIFINGYAFKKETFYKHFILIDEYRNKKLEQLL